MAAWHCLLVLAAVVAMLRQQRWCWDEAVVRQWLGSVLLSLAAWRLGSVSAKRVERSVRLGMVVTLDEALRGAADHEVNELDENRLLL